MNLSKQRRRFLQLSAFTPSILLAQVGCEPLSALNTKRLGYLAIRGGKFDFFAIFESLKRRAKATGTELLIEGYSVDPQELSMLPEHAKKILATRPDFLFAPSVGITKAFMVQTKEIPIGFLVWSDPVAHELVQNLGSPEKNVTGVSGAIGTILPLLQRLRLAYPAISSIALISDGRERNELPVNQETIRQLGFDRIAVCRCLGKEAVALLADLAKKGYQAALFTLSTGFLDEGLIIAEAAIKQRIILVAEDKSFVKVGFALSYQPVAKNIPEKITTLLDLLMRGVPPTNIPVEMPTEFSLAVNLTTVKQIGLKMTSAFLALADTHYE